jgi:hypothetical protein
VAVVVRHQPIMEILEVLVVVGLLQEEMALLILEGQELQDKEMLVALVCVMVVVIQTQCVLVVEVVLVQLAQVQTQALEIQVMVVAV